MVKLMFILNKRKIIFFNLIILFSITFYIFTYQSQNYNSLSTSSLPVNNHTIVLDAGHGNPDGGAVSNDNQTIESELNLSIVQKLQSLLESSGSTVILTRSDENGIYDSDSNSIRSKKVSDMKNRTKIGNTSNADIFVSIHMNKLPQTQYSGWQTFYKNTDEESMKIAKSIQENLNYFIQTPNKREVKSIKDIYLTQNIEIPLVLVECGFLSNENELNLLKKDEYQSLLAWSIYSGIMDYFN